jgi:pyruvate/2-oxoglutarate dehydrogenase complex dihydrolipoamide dehydrogenase (E3) component
MTAGTAQRLINIDGYVPGRRVVVVGSGDIGLIMARRMKLIGAEVPAVVEIQPVPSGINRNIVQCLDDFGIPLYLGHVVAEIRGDRRVTGVTVAPLENGVSRPDRGFSVDCDTILLSVGLIPENEISRNLGVELHRQTLGPVVDSRLMTSVSGVFAAGNVLHIHDLVDYASEEGARAGRAVVEFLNDIPSPPEIELVPGSNVRYVCPGRLRTDQTNRLYFRTLIAKANAVVEVCAGEHVVLSERHQHVQPSEMITIDLDGKAVPAGAERMEVRIK